MTVSDTQLETWTQVPSSTKFKDTYAAVKEALSKHGIFPEDSRYEVYLQGSYACTTHIKEDSDVDVVVELTTTYRAETKRLTSEEKARYDADRTLATYLWAHFKRDVINALCEHFGTSNVVEGNKAIKVFSKGTNLYADVIVCEQYKEYTKYPSYSEARFYKGIIFWSKDGKEIINFPKHHVNNGSEKNKVASEYKPSIRMLKNLKRELVDAGTLGKSTAPSYFVESLLYNVPDERFGTNRRATVIGVLNWFHTLTDTEKTTLVCQNRIIPLFGLSDQQWNYEDARRLMWGVMELIKQ